MGLNSCVRGVTGDAETEVSKMGDFSHTEPVVKPRRRRRIGRWLLLALVIAIAAFEGYAYLAMHRAASEARAAGAPLTFTEIEAARTTWPDDRNGALVLLGIKDQLVQLAKTEEFANLPWLGCGASDLPLGERWTDARRAEIDQFLQAAAPELKQIDSLKNYEGGRMPFDPNADILLADYDIAFIRTAIKLKALQTVDRAMAGETDSVVDDLTILIRVGNVLAEEPTLIGSLVNVACNALTVHALQHTCALATLTPEQLKTIDGLLSGIEKSDRLYWGMLGERALNRTARKAIMAQDRRNAIFPYVPGIHAWLMQDEATALGMLNRMVEATKAKPDGGLAAAHKIDQELQQLSRILHPITTTTLPSLGRAFEINLNLTAQVRAARAAMAAERFRIDRQQFPSALAELVPDYTDAIPLDPFDGKAMRYRLTPERLVIYSIGDDMKDDGGDVAPKVNKNERAKDWGFVLLPPELRGRAPAATTTPATQPADR